MDGTLALQISNETVPDLAMAKVDLNNIFFFIFSETSFLLNCVFCCQSRIVDFHK